MRRDNFCTNSSFTRKMAVSYLTFITPVASQSNHPSFMFSVIPRSNPCIRFTSCTSPVTIPTTRIMTALFSLNLFRFADDQFLPEVCQELEEKSSCETFLHQCRNEEWPETADFQNSDFELSLWVCANRARFEANAGCWEDPFL